MKLHTRFLLGVVLVISLGAAQASSAAYDLADQQTKCVRLDELNKPDIRTIKASLTGLISLDCLGWYADTWSVSRGNFSVFSLGPDPKKWFEKRKELIKNGRYKEYLRSKVQERLRVVIDALQKDLNDPAYVLDESKGSALRVLRLPMEHALETVAQGLHSDEKECGTGSANQYSCADKVDKWTYQDTGSTGYSDGTLIPTQIERDFLRPNCTGRFTTNDRQCKKAYATAKRFIQYTKAIKFLMRMYVDHLFYELHEESLLYKKQWENYFGKARSQYIWELNLNSRLYAKKLRKAEGDLAKDGFKPPPNYQWIRFHPSVALEYVGGDSQGNRLQEAVMFEWFGYNHWTWKGSKMQNPRGISIVSSLSDRADGDVLSHGLMFHYNHNLSFGFTQRSNSRTGFFVSIDLVKQITERREKVEAEFKNRFSDFKTN